jgi:hypothetical protein
VPGENVDGGSGVTTAEPNAGIPGRGEQGPIQ